MTNLLELAGTEFLANIKSNPARKPMGRQVVGDLACFASTMSAG